MIQILGVRLDVVQSCEKVDVALWVINGLQAAMSEGWLLLLEGKPQREEFLTNNDNGKNSRTLVAVEFGLICAFSTLFACLHTVSLAM